MAHSKSSTLRESLCCIRKFELDILYGLLAALEGLNSPPKVTLPTLVSGTRTIRGIENDNLNEVALAIEEVVENSIPIGDDLYGRVPTVSLMPWIASLWATIQTENPTPNLSTEELRSRRSHMARYFEATTAMLEAALLNDLTPLNDTSDDSDMKSNPVSVVLHALPPTFAADLVELLRTSHSELLQFVRFEIRKIGVMIICRASKSFPPDDNPIASAIFDICEAFGAPLSLNLPEENRVEIAEGDELAEYLTAVDHRRQHPTVRQQLDHRYRKHIEAFVLWLQTTNEEMTITIPAMTIGSKTSSAMETASKESAATHLNDLLDLVVSTSGTSTQQLEPESFLSCHQWVTAPGKTNRFSEAQKLAESLIVAAGAIGGLLSRHGVATLDYSVDPTDYPCPIQPRHLYQVVINQLLEFFPITSDDQNTEKQLTQLLRELFESAAAAAGRQLPPDTATSVVAQLRLGATTIFNGLATAPPAMWPLRNQQLPNYGTPKTNPRPSGPGL